MKLLIQGENSRAARQEVEETFKTFLNLGIRLSWYKQPIPEKSDEYVLNYYLQLKTEFLELADLLSDFSKQVSEQEKKDWIEDKRNENETHDDLFQKIAQLWDFEIVPIGDTSKIKLIAKDRYFEKTASGKSTNDLFVTVLNQVQIIVNNGSVDGVDLSVGQKSSLEVSAIINENPNFPNVYKTYTGVVGPDLLPFPFPASRPVDVNKFAGYFNQLPKVIYRKFDATLLANMGHLFLDKRYFLHKKVENGFHEIYVLMQPVWYRDEITENDAKITTFRQEVTSIVIHHTTSSDYAQSAQSWVTGKNEVSIHYCIDKDGSIVKHALDNWTTHQTGASHWLRQNKNKNVNNFSIGIEIVHERENDEFTKQQYDALIGLIKRLKELYNEPIAANRLKFKYKDDPIEYIKYNGNIINVIGHSDTCLSKGTKGQPPTSNSQLGGKPRCPGLKFDWRLLEKEKIGLYFQENRFTIDDLNKTIEDADLLVHIDKKVDFDKWKQELTSSAVDLNDIRFLIDHNILKESIPAAITEYDKNAQLKKVEADNIRKTAEAALQEAITDHEKTRARRALDTAEKNYKIACHNLVVSKFFEDLERVGYFCGINNTFNKSDKALQMFQIHFHNHIFPPEIEGNQFNWGEREKIGDFTADAREEIAKNKYIHFFTNKDFYLTKYQKPYASKIFTISLFILIALMREPFPPKSPHLNQ